MKDDTWYVCRYVQDEVLQEEDVEALDFFLVYSALRPELGKGRDERDYVTLCLRQVVPILLRLEDEILIPFETTGLYFPILACDFALFRSLVQCIKFNFGHEDCGY